MNFCNGCPILILYDIGSSHLQRIGGSLYEVNSTKGTIILLHDYTTG